MVVLLVGSQSLVVLGFLMIYIYIHIFLGMIAILVGDYFCVSLYTCLGMSKFQVLQLCSLGSSVDGFFNQEFFYY